MCECVNVFMCVALTLPCLALSCFALSYLDHERQQNLNPM